jgi:hypothetical protein
LHFGLRKNEGIAEHGEAILQTEKHAGFCKQMSTRRKTLPLDKPFFIAVGVIVLLLILPLTIVVSQRNPIQQPAQAAYLQHRLRSTNTPTPTKKLSPTLTPTQAAVTISEGYATYQSPLKGWYAALNPYNAEGNSYAESITSYPDTFPNNTVLNWSYPNTPGPGNVWAYPEVVYGYLGGISNYTPSGEGITPVQVKNLTALTGSYNVTLQGNTDQYDVLWETHLTTAPASNEVCEFSIMLHSPSYFTQYVMSLPEEYDYHAAGLSATIVNAESSSNPYIIVMPKQGDMLSATVDIKSILTFLISKGVVSGDWYIEGFELGVEPQQGSGSITINSLSYNWNGDTNAIGHHP